uniref:Phosphoenolpyruvate carboxykinase (ATP) n=1 Tax=Pseudictyota dubia TaxID=2749911 RepID=A0A7R9VFW0_9STRA
MQEKINKHESQAWLVNTGWSGGQYGVGERMSIKTTRACIDSILEGSAAEASTVIDPIFGFDVPTSLPGVDSHVLDPKHAWENPEEYDATAKKLAGMFIKNFEKYAGKGSTDYTQHGPQI